MLEKNIRILIADDHQLFISGLKFILSNEFDVQTIEQALNGKEAIEKCRLQNFDIILMDINMPIIDGIEATKSIKILDKKCKILIVSMLSDYETVCNVLKSGADGFLIKNADVSEFKNAFSTIQNENFYMSPSLAKLYTKDKNDLTINKKDYIRFTENLVTPREKSILKMIAEGATNQAIANTLFISVKTVDTHRNNMLAKLNLPNTAALISFAIHNKLVE